MGSFSIWHWLIVLLVVVLLFGTKKLRNLGGDLGEAVKGFKKGLNSDEAAKLEADERPAPTVTPTVVTPVRSPDSDRRD